MAFSVLCSMIGALVVSQLGLLEPRPEQKLEKIVFDQSGLTRAEEIAQRVEAGHIAMREVLAAQEAEARRLAATPLEREPVTTPAPAKTQGSSQTAAQSEKKKPAPKVASREAATREVASAAPVAPPLVITPATTEQPAATARSGTKDIFDKLADGVGKIRDFVVNAVRIEKPATLPFGSASASANALPLMDDMQARLKMPSFGM